MGKGRIKCDNAFNAISVIDGEKTAFNAGIHGMYARKVFSGSQVKIYDEADTSSTEAKVIVDKYGVNFGSSSGEYTVYTYPASGLFNIYFDDDTATLSHYYTFKATGRGYWDAIAFIRMNGVGTGVYGFHCAGGTLSSIATVFGNTGIPTKLTASYTSSTGVFSLSASSSSNTFKCTLIGAWL